MKKIVKLFVLLLLAVGIFLAAQAGNSFYEKTETVFCPCHVTRVVDGDTICVKIDASDEEKKIRLIGVNTPESVSSDESQNCEEGIAAASFTSSYLPVGSAVFLEFDEETTDRYGRTLAYVWLSDEADTNSFEDFCTYNFGAILLENTYCEAVYYAPNGKYKDWYEQLEKQYQ